MLTFYGVMALLTALYLVKTGELEGISEWVAMVIFALLWPLVLAMLLLGKNRDDTKWMQDVREGKGSLDRRRQQPSRLASENELNGEA